jgi:hypothetical protein
VFLCGTTPFAGQVIVSKSLTLTGTSGAAISAPATFSSSSADLPPQFATDNLFVPQSLLTIWGASVKVKVAGLTIEGPLPGNGSCANDEFGILVLDGANATINKDRVLNIRDANSGLHGCQYGVGIQVGRKYWPTADFSTFKTEDFVGTAAIVASGITGYQKNGITVDGPGSIGAVSNNAIVGDGAGHGVSTIIAQNGVQISRGAKGSVRGNSITTNQYTPPSTPTLNSGASSAGVLLFGGCGDELVTGVSVSGNKLTNNDVGIYLNNYNAACNNAAPTKTSDVAASNKLSSTAITNNSPFTDSSDNTWAGYQVGIDDIGNGDTIDYNTISGVGYTAQQTPGTAFPQNVFVLPIDTVSFPTIGVKVHGNHISPAT